MDDQRKDKIDAERRPQGNRNKQLQTHTCLPMTWKILTARIRKEIYYSPTSHRLLPEEQKGRHKASRGTDELLYIDQHIPNERKV